MFALKSTVLTIGKTRRSNGQSVQLGIRIAERRLQCSAPEGLVQFVWKANGQRHLSGNLPGNPAGYAELDTRITPAGLAG